MVQAPGFLTLAAQLVSQRLVEIGGGDGQLVVRGLEEEVREDGDGGLALDDGLRGGQLAQQLGAGDGDLEVAGGAARGLLGDLGLRWWSRSSLLYLIRKA